MRSRPRLAFLLVAATAWVLPSSSRAQMRENTRPEVIASGQGLVRISPNTVRVRLGLTLHGDTASSVSRVASEKIAAVSEALAVIDPDMESPSISTYRVYPGRRLEGMTFVTEYHVRASIEVVLHDLPRFREAVEAALGAGASSLESVQFEAAQRDSARRNALALAVEDARANAETMAKAYGGDLGPALEISNAGYSGLSYRDGGFVGSSIMEDFADVPKDIEVRAWVTTRWMLVKRTAAEH